MLKRYGILALVVVCVAVPLVAGCAKPSATQVAEGMVDSMAKGDFASATKHFDAACKAALPAEGLGPVWSQFTAQAGAFKSRTGSREAQEAGYQMVYVTCQFEKTTMDIKVVFDKDGKVTGLGFVPHVSAADAQYSPPAYADKDRFVEREVTVGTGEWQLPGTLTMPKGEGPFPAVVLVHGSGPNDRDETIGPNKPFKDIAWGLASRGIAVLRYDKRSKVYGPKMATMANMGKMDNFTVKEEVIDDALAAAKVLRGSTGIDPKRVFVLGHSNGGLLAPRIGKADPKIAGLIMMAGCITQPVEKCLLRQATYIASLSGPITDDAKKEIDKQVQSLMKSVPDSYNQDFDDYIRAATEMAKSLKQPMLVIQGARDYQAIEADFNTWKAALSSRTDVTFKLYPDLNHLFMTGKGMATPSEYEKHGFVSETVVNDIAAWINGH
jgi:dienelactone hydrolase